MNISKLDFDWRSLLIKRYKNYGLNENDVAVILCIYEIIKEKQYLVSAEEIEPMMTIKKEKIDGIITNLFERRFISFEKVDNKTVTSLEPLINKIFTDTQKDLMIEAQDNIRTDAKSKSEAMYAYFEQLLGRSLTSLEFDKICSWYREGATDGMVKEATEKVKQKSKRVTINAVDKMILSLEKSADINQEGYTTRSEDWRQGTAKTIEQLKGKWLEDDK